MNNKGFTFVEIVSMLIVISVMTLLSMPLLSKELKDVKKEETLGACNLIKQSLKTYYYKSNVESKKTLDLANEKVQKELDINLNIENGNATIDENGKKIGKLNQEKNPTTINKIRCNHYITKSHAEYMARCNLGSAGSGAKVKTFGRDPETNFRRFNKNDVYDPIMKKYVTKLKKLK